MFKRIMLFVFQFKILKNMLESIKGLRGWCHKDYKNSKSMTLEWLAKGGILQEVYNLGLCISLHFQIIINKWNIGSGWKHQCWCVWGDWGKLPTIIWICKRIGECVGWSTIVIFTSRESRIGSNKVHNRNMGSWICGFGDDQVIFLRSMDSVKKKDM